jgi:hypothetical protein
LGTSGTKTTPIVAVDRRIAHVGLIAAIDRVDFLAPAIRSSRAVLRPPSREGSGRRHTA